MKSKELRFRIAGVRVLQFLVDADDAFGGRVRCRAFWREHPIDYLQIWGNHLLLQGMHRRKRKQNLLY